MKIRQKQRSNFPTIYLQLEARCTVFTIFLSDREPEKDYKRNALDRCMQDNNQRQYHLYASAQNATHRISLSTPVPLVGCISPQIPGIAGWNRSANLHLELFELVTNKSELLWSTGMYFHRVFFCHFSCSNLLAIAELDCIHSQLQQNQSL